MKISDFISVVGDLEKRQLGDPVFWKTRAKIGDHFLSKPLDRQKISAHFHEFLSKWASYRHEIDWQKLVNSWGGEQQILAAGLINSHLESASDLELSKAASLFNHLWESSIAGLGTTNISKLLALGLPSICMMWDQGIMNDFKKTNTPPRPGFRIRTVSTYQKFLLHRRMELNDLITQIQAQRLTSRDQAIIWLRQLPTRVN